MSTSIPENTNPRLFFRNHKERSFTKLIYTYEDIARICNLSIGTVRQYRAELTNLKNVAIFICKHLKLIPKV